MREVRLLRWRSEPERAAPGCCRSASPRSGCWLEGRRAPPGLRSTWPPGTTSYPTWDDPQKLGAAALIPPSLGDDMSLLRHPSATAASAAGTARRSAVNGVEDGGELCRCTDHCHVTGVEIDDVRPEQRNGSLLEFLDVTLVPGEVHVRPGDSALVAA
jgi:hypothetical protein